MKAFLFSIVSFFFNVLGSVAIFGISSKRCADWFTMYSAYYAKQSVVNNQLFFGGFEGAAPYRNTYNML